MGFLSLSDGRRNHPPGSFGFERTAGETVRAQPEKQIIIEHQEKTPVQDQSEKPGPEDLQALGAPTEEYPKNPDAPYFPGGQDQDGAVGPTPGPAFNDLLVIQERPVFRGV